MSAYATAMLEACRENLISEVLRQRDRATNAERDRDDARREIIELLTKDGLEITRAMRRGEIIGERGWNYLVVPVEPDAFGVDGVMSKTEEAPNDPHD